MKLKIKPVWLYMPVILMLSFCIYHILGNKNIPLWQIWSLSGQNLLFIVFIIIIKLTLNDKRVTIYSNLSIVYFLFKIIYNPISILYGDATGILRLILIALEISLILLAIYLTIKKDNDLYLKE